MRIECLGTIGIVHTKQVPYWYKRKGYYIGEKYVKAKKIRKYKTVQLKKPYLSGSVHLRVYSDLVMGGVYVDERGKKYMCVSNQFFTKTVCLLRICSTNLGSTFEPPQSLTLIMQSIPA